MHLVSEITQRSLTIRFTMPVVAGQYVNGDWWAISPTIEDVTADYDGPINMHVPGAPEKHGLDPRAPGYDHLLARTVPFALPMGTQGIVSVSWRDDDPNAPEKTSKGYMRPFTRDAVILTSVAAPPLPTAFRPSYMGEWIGYDWSEVATANLLALEPSPSCPTEITSKLDFWYCPRGHSSEVYSLPDATCYGYGQDAAEAINDAILWLSTGHGHDKTSTLIKVIQIGIDLYGAHRAGVQWPGAGGHASGRWWPIVFAGHLLGEDDMRDVSIGVSRDSWGEMSQTYRVTQELRDRFPSYYNGHNVSVGDAWWGIKHSWRPRNDDEESYRTCCTAVVWSAHALCARLYGLMDAHDHPEFFEYTDRYMNEFPAGHKDRSDSDFAEEMWDLHR